jgi:hypothetical protein
VARRKHNLHVGDYLRFTRFRGQTLKRPLWALITQVTADQGRADVVLRGDAEDFASPVITFDSQAQVDRVMRDTVSPDDVPDEVVVEIAKRALLS